jgi:hypothetical protein
MDAASEVRALPIVETSCPVQRREKLRFRKTANGEVEAVLDIVMETSPHASVVCILLALQLEPYFPSKVVMDISFTSAFPLSLPWKELFILS